MQSSAESETYELLERNKSTRDVSRWGHAQNLSPQPSLRRSSAGTRGSSANADELFDGKSLTADPFDHKYVHRTAQELIPA